MKNVTCTPGVLMTRSPMREHGTMRAWRAGCRGAQCVIAYEAWLDEKHPTVSITCARCSTEFEAASNRKVCTTCRSSTTSVANRESEAKKAFDQGGNSGLAEHLLSLASAVTGIAGCRKLSIPGNSGYPEVAVGGKRVKAHRVVAEHVFGVLGGGEVHHKCAQRSCINPDHLQMVSRSENRAEMLLRNQYIRYIRALSDRLEELNHDDALAARAREFLREQDWRD